MPKYSQKSLSKLSQCHGDIQKVFDKVIEVFDNTVITGYRNKEEQEAHYRAGRSQLRYPNSKHNTKPCIAIDAAPYPIDWHDRERFCLFAGYVLGVADSMNIKLRWGGDWDRDTQVKDNSFDDLLHFELIK
jgi:hypothetical protein